MRDKTLYPGFGQTALDDSATYEAPKMVSGEDLPWASVDDATPVQPFRIYLSTAEPSLEFTEQVGGASADTSDSRHRVRALPLHMRPAFAKRTNPGRLPDG